ncbi:unnamed protein product [Adineta steineri]|uniref:Uncharacterized protein n=1 Tax=Adineta steineri TaxID=433720 RepID=A0A814MUM3_9BILA|nr:unnamed protein product [Adineta steineri]CAF3481489.1 unnamed protein product [Adineta steineri]
MTTKHASKPTASSGRGNRLGQTAHSSTVTQMLSDSKQYFKSLVLRLKTKRTTEECQVELHRIVGDMKTDVSTNIDALIQHVVEMRPAPGSPNYEQTSRLYDLILDQVMKMMEDLEKTFTGIFGEFSANMERLWKAISNDREEDLNVAQENFRTILEKYSVQWNQAFQHANQTVHDFEKQLTQKSMERNVGRNQL